MDRYLKDITEDSINKMKDYYLKQNEINHEHQADVNEYKRKLEEERARYRAMHDRLTSEVKLLKSKIKILLNGIPSLRLFNETLKFCI